MVACSIWKCISIQDRHWGEIPILVRARPNTGEACLWAMLSFLSVFSLSLKIFLWTVLCSVSKCQNEAASDKSEIYIYDFCKFIHLQPHPKHMDDRACPGWRHCCCKHLPLCQETPSLQTEPFLQQFPTIHIDMLTYSLSWAGTEKFVTVDWKSNTHCLPHTWRKYAFLFFFVPLLLLPPGFLRALTDK